MNQVVQEPTFAHWCIVELMGHQRIAGMVTEETLFGSALMRVDVPAVEAKHRPGFTKYCGASAIYAITPVEEQIARAVAEAYDNRPVEEWRLERLLTPPDDDYSGQGADFVDTSALQRDDDED